MSEKSIESSRVFVYDIMTKKISGYAEDTLVISEPDKKKFDDIIMKISSANKPLLVHSDICVRNIDGHFTLADIGFVCVKPGANIIITVVDIGIRCWTVNDHDKLTGLYSRTAFSEMMKRYATENTSEKLIIVYFDVQRFKNINDMFGLKEGDRLLKYIADVINEAVGNCGIGCRIDSDRFVLAVKIDEHKITEFVENLLDRISEFDLPFEVSCNAGIYITGDEQIPPDLTVDRAIMAQSVIKGSYTKRYNIYTEIMRKNLITEYEITGMMKAAVRNQQFLVYYQPQYNHSTGMLVGAEGLVRWLHPEKGLIPPGSFIPVLEKNGFITTLDLYVFEKVCEFLRNCIDKKLHIVPVSTNLTRYDIFSADFIEKLEETRKKYDVPPKYIRIEITESVALGNSHFINEAVRKLHSYGYVVEMDDFGSGYSSLNILKDIDFDIIKLDMKFLDKSQGEQNRGGTILSSIVRMVNWLGLPIIAEGVETVQQADFLKSIGCDYIQGYLYSKPLPEKDYLELISKSRIGATIPHMKLIDTLNAGNFWSNDSLETLIFSNFVGGAAIFEYKDGKPEILRVNQKYLAELGMNLSEKEIVNLNPLDFFDETNKRIFIKTLEKAIQTADEQECETWRTIKSSCCGEERMCIRTTLRMIGKSKDSNLFYAMIRNVTAEKNHYANILDSERRFKMASEQVNIYYWEYTISSHEMRPCFRCMRDLGLPALLTNYPDSAIEMGIFPPEVADMYRDWHKQIAEGVPNLEAVIPLTMDRIPFRVKYTTEFDENGTPIKAYGSAAFIINND